MTRSRYIFLKAFQASLPILLGYGVMGFAAGVLVAAKTPAGEGPLWSALGAVSVSGTLQFLICDWYRDHPSLLYVAAMTLAVSFRYALYGFSLINR